MSERCVHLWRLRWRHPDWEESTSDRIRLFYREDDARRAMIRLLAAGHSTELARADQAVTFSVTARFEAEPILAAAMQPLAELQRALRAERRSA